ncbi:MAG TPA: hypothetical protein VM345_10595 [Acidimicrobiales bacterium]|jgi:hypothetical protein|nr:hypothetical protein [Acidimicrobiales bacterium]
MPRTNTYSDDDMATAVARAARDLGDSVSASAYDRWSRGESGTPSVRTIINRFGSWNAARAAAGLPVDAPAREYVEQWTKAACLESVQEWLLTRPFSTSAKAYSEWATGHRDRASMATVRAKFGGWTAALEAARAKR